MCFAPASGIDSICQAHMWIDIQLKLAMTPCYWIHDVFGRHFSRCRRKSVSMSAGLIWRRFLWLVWARWQSAYLSSPCECLPGSSSGQRVVVTGMGVVSPFGTDKEAMGGEEGSHVLTARLSHHDAVAEVKLPGFLPELAGRQISSIPSSWWFCAAMLLIAVHPEAIKRITKFDAEAMMRCLTECTHVSVCPELGGL